MRFFFYGTLLDAQVRALVIGRRATRLQPATLAGYHRVGIVGVSYPMLVPDSDGRVEGGLSPRLNRAAARRIAAYCGL